ncbi:MAG: hypothetical protein PSY12_10485 [bacterium]|nr:hypothetical protein [bacterium]
MLLLVRCLDWFCAAFAAAAQDEVRLNELMLSACMRKPVADAVAPDAAHPAA